MMDETGKRRVVAVRFGSAGPLAYYEAGSFDLAAGETVEVEIGGQRRLATVALTPDDLEVVNLPDSLPPVISCPDPEEAEKPSETFVKADCSREPCCQVWQARFNPPAIGCQYLFCNARFEPGRYEEMRRDWPAVGQNISGPVVGSEDKTS